MKIPSTVFVLHCPNLKPERRVRLEKHLDERLPIKNVRWFEDYNHDHPFVEWLQHTQKLPYGPKITSKLVKFLEILKAMIVENTESALILNDDVLFHRDWVKIFNSIDTGDNNIIFMNLGSSLNLDFKPESGKIFQVKNIYGCEGVYVSKQFAQMFLQSLNMNSSLESSITGFLEMIEHPLLCIPICFQTSIICKDTSLDHETMKEEKTSKQQNYFTILKEYDEYRKLKKSKEDLIFKNYGTRVDLRNINFVIGK